MSTGAQGTLGIDGTARKSVQGKSRIISPGSARAMGLQVSIRAERISPLNHVNPTCSVYSGR